MGCIICVIQLFLSCRIYIVRQLSPSGGGRGRMLGDLLTWQQIIMNMYILYKKLFFDLLSTSSPCPLQRGIVNTLFLVMIMISCNSSVKKTTAADDFLPQDTIIEKITEPETIIDSQMTFEEAIAGTNAPQNIIDQLVLIDVEYYSTDDKLHRGQLLLNRSIEKDIVAIFDSIKSWRFPIAQAIPIVAFGWDDNLSMAANNTSSFCYRKVAGTDHFSRHAKGMAIDINPFFNPMIWKTPYENRPNKPENAQYNEEIPGTLYLEHPVVQEFIKRNFKWGYYFPRYYDIHHFQKR